MARGGLRLDVTLDEIHAAKLRRLAERTQTPEGTLAGWLLACALDEETDTDARRVAGVLDGIPDAYDRAELGRRQAAVGETITLEEL